VLQHVAGVEVAYVGDAVLHHGGLLRGRWFSSSCVQGAANVPPGGSLKPQNQRCFDDSDLAGKLLIKMVDPPEQRFAIATLENSMRLAFRSLTILALLAAPSLAAHADTYHFTFTSNPGFSTDSFSFDLPSTPTPTVYSFGAFDIGGVEVTFDGTTSSEDVVFAGSFLAIGDNYIFSGTAPLFTGPGYDPTFILGTFDMFEDPQGIGTLAVTDISNPSTVPEPSTFALFGTGVVGLAGFARRRFFAS
jgi:hypothetical protein